MNWRSAAEAVFNVIVTWGYWAIGLIAVAAFVAPLFETATEEDPTAGAGTSAPIIALCTAAVLLSQAVGRGGMRFRRMPQHIYWHRKRGQRISMDGIGSSRPSI